MRALFVPFALQLHAGEINWDEGLGLGLGLGLGKGSGWGN